MNTPETRAELLNIIERLNMPENGQTTIDDIKNYIIDVASIVLKLVEERGRR